MKYLYLSILSVLVGCSQSSGEWEPVGKIDLGAITPIGLTMQNDQLWVSDGDHNQLVKINQEGKVLETIKGFERPMHLDSDGTMLYIPEYGSDNIVQLENGEKTIFEIPDSLDAPAGIAIYRDEIGIADFYNHRILYYDGKNWNAMGSEGRAAGELYYPTDVSINKDKIFVADAYNNRIQVFDKKGNYQQVIGTEEKINAATGIFVTAEEIFITDFENDRVLSYDHTGTLKQIFSDGIDKPTDILVAEKTLYIANYKGKNILTFRQ